MMSPCDQPAERAELDGCMQAALTQDPYLLVAMTGVAGANALTAAAS